jgi:hypothetical protein
MSYEGSSCCRFHKIVAALEYSDLSEKWSAYSPLKDVQTSFSSLASSNEQAALAISNNYDQPGGGQEVGDSERRLKRTPMRMKVSQFRDEARRAWGVLALYESVLNGDAPAVKDLFLELRDDKVFSFWNEYFRFEHVEDPNQALLQIGLMSAAQTVEEAVHELCRRRIRFSQEGDRSPDFSTVHTAWDFDDLLGAMYLQMWWLMAFGGDITRCEFCGRIVLLARPHPAGRKRRRDKRFCYDACRQAYHRSKKKRQARGS